MDGHSLHSKTEIEGLLVVGYDDGELDGLLTGVTDS